MKDLASPPAFLIELRRPRVQDKTGRSRFGSCIDRMVVFPSRLPLGDLSSIWKMELAAVLCWVRVRVLSSFSSLIIWF